MNTEPALLLTVDEARKRLSVGRTVLYRLLADSSIRSIMIGKSRRIPVQALEEFVATRMAEQGEPVGHVPSSGVRVRHPVDVV